MVLALTLAPTLAGVASAHALGTSPSSSGATLGSSGIRSLTPLVSVAAQKTHTCQATRRTRAARHLKFFPIACEQPPKMNMVDDALAKALAVAALG